MRVGQIVRVCQSPGLSLVDTPRLGFDGIRELPHDCNDSSQHWISRVVGTDCLGRTLIATRYGNNPHCCDWPYGDSSLTPIESEDWLEKSLFHVGDIVQFVWELEGFDGAKVGQRIEAKLKAAHIKPGDWIVAYPRQDDGLVIQRVINESQMLGSMDNV